MATQTDVAPDTAALFPAAWLAGIAVAAGTLSAFSPPVPARGPALHTEASYYARTLKSASSSWTWVPEPTAPADLTVAELRDLNGLTASQLGRLFGVSRRSINNWMAGGPMASRHQARLFRLQAALAAVPGGTPEARRAALLDSSRGTSLFHQLVAQVPEDFVVHVPPLAPGDQV